MRITTLKAQDCRQWLTGRCSLLRRKRSGTIPDNRIEEIDMLTVTHPEAEAVQQELLRRKSAAEKFAIVRALTATVVSLCPQGIRERHPEFDERDVDIHLVEMNYGRELAEGLRRRLEGDGA